MNIYYQKYSTVATVEEMDLLDVNSQIPFNIESREEFPTLRYFNHDKQVSAVSPRFLMEVDLETSFAGNGTSTSIATTKRKPTSPPRPLHIKILYSDRIRYLQICMRENNANMYSEIFRNAKMGEDIVAMKKVQTMQQDREGILSFLACKFSLQVL